MSPEPNPNLTKHTPDIE
ncbi:hypothetical protein Pcinc_017346, partial [Petrolisthes cinctipes]